MPASRCALAAGIAAVGADASHASDTCVTGTCIRSPIQRRRHLGEEVWIRATASMVEVPLRGRRIAVHGLCISRKSGTNLPRACFASFEVRSSGTKRFRRGAVCEP